MTKETFVRAVDTPADAAAVAARPTPHMKELAYDYPPCGHCNTTDFKHHCPTHDECDWLICRQCAAIIDPGDWSHAYESYPNKNLSHGRVTGPACW